MGYRSGGRRAALVFVVYTLLTALYTWPLVADLDGSLTPIADTYSHVWAVNWVARQLVLDPLHLYDANMFWPHPASLAYRDSLISQGLMATPLRLLGAGPLLAHNVVLLLTFVVAAFGAYLLAFDLCRSRAGAFLAGLIFAFSHFRWTAFAQINVLSVQWLPLVLFCFRRSALEPTPRRLLGLAVFSVLLALSSGYYAVLLALAVCACGIADLRVLLRRRSLPHVAAALAVAAAACALIASPQINVRGRTKTSWGKSALEHWSARPDSYLQPGDGLALPHLEWLREKIRPSRPLYPGTAALVLFAFGVGWRQERRRLALLLALTGLSLSLGPRISAFGIDIPGPFEWFRSIPPVDMMRTPIRLSVLAHLGIALLAALGAARLMRQRRMRVLVGFLVALQAAEGYPRALREEVQPAEPAAASTTWLSSAARGPVLELPWDMKNRDRQAGLYLYWSTAHWQPLVNGISTFQPRGSLGLGALAARFPSPRTARLLRGEGVRYVVIHMRMLRRERRQHLLDATPPPGVSLVRLGTDLVFEISRAGPTEGRPKSGPGPGRSRKRDPSGAS